MESKVKCPHSISRTCLAQEFGLVGEESLFSKGFTTGQSHPLQSKRDGDEKEDGADGAGLVDDQEVGGVEEQQEQMAGHQRY